MAKRRKIRVKKYNWYIYKHRYGYKRKYLINFLFIVILKNTLNKL